jgi:hypothetical protein
MTEANHQVMGLSNTGFAAVSRLMPIKMAIASDRYHPIDNTETVQNLEVFSNIHKELF